MRTLEGQTIADAGSWTSEDCKRLRTSADAEVGTNADGKRLRTIADAESWTNADARRPWTIADDNADEKPSRPHPPIYVPKRPQC